MFLLRVSCKRISPLSRRICSALPGRTLRPTHFRLPRDELSITYNPAIIINQRRHCHFELVHTAAPTFYDLWQALTVYYLNDAPLPGRALYVSTVAHMLLWRIWVRCATRPGRVHRFCIYLGARVLWNRRRRRQDFGPGLCNAYPV